MYLIKIAEDDKKIKQKAALLGAGGVAAGTGFVHSAYKDGGLTGRRTLYHGTLPKNVESVLQKGILRKFSGRPGSRTETVLGDDKELFQKAINKVYLTPKKRLALDLTRENRLFDQVDKRGIIKTRLPISEFKSVPNPEARGSFEEWLKHIPNLGQDENIFIRKALKPLYKGISKDTATFEKDVPTKYIVGSKDYQRASIKEIREHMRKNPRVFAKGVGKAALGVGLASAGIYGAKKMIDQHRRKKEREKVASQQKTRAMKHPSRNEGRWDDLIFLPEGEEKELRGQYSRLRGGRRYTVNKRNQFIRMKLRGENPYSNQV